MVNDIYALAILCGYVRTVAYLCQWCMRQHEFDMATGLAEDEQPAESKGTQPQSRGTKAFRTRPSGGSKFLPAAGKQSTKRKKARRKHEQAQ